MNRRTFLIQGIVATLGLTALPAAASALAQLPVALGAQKAPTPDYLYTEAEVMEDILSYVAWWDEDLPGHDFKELLFRRLVTEKTGMSYSEFSNHSKQLAEKAKAATMKDDWTHHAMALSGS